MRINEDNTKPPRKPSLWQVIGSVLAAAFGVQSNKNRERDASHGRPATYIAAGLVFTLLFVLAVIGAVKLVLHLAGN